MHALLLLLAGLYVLPDAGSLPEPDAVQRQRIERALETLRKAEGEEGEVAVRELALVGEPALPFVAARLNDAGAGERLLLLAAVSRLARAAPLLEQAQRDPHPAIRAWRAVPARDPADADVRLLAKRYVDVLALAEEKRREEVDADLAEARYRLGRPRSDAEASHWHELMQDRELARAIQRKRDLAASRFARVGGEALRRGALRPDLKDPVFVAYLALLREESWAMHYAVLALVDRGEEMVPILEAVLDGRRHDPRKILRLLLALDPERARRLYESFATRDEDTQRAMVRLAPETLAPEERPPFLERAALAEEGSVRRAALERLLDLDPPAGVEPAKKLLDPAAYGAEDFKGATLLLARAGEIEPLLEYATIAVPGDNSEMASRLRLLRMYCRYALGETEGAARAAAAERFLGGETSGERQLGLALLDDLDRLREHIDEELVRRRLLDEDGARGLETVVRWHEAQAQPVKHAVVKAAAEQRDVERLVTWAAGPDADVRALALRQLAGFDRIETRFEEALLAIHDAEPGEEVLAALLPLGTPAVRERFVAAGADALGILASRSRTGKPLAFTVPLAPHLQDADDRRLVKIGLITLGAPSVEPGLVAALLDLWKARLSDDDAEDLDPDAGAIEQRVFLVNGLARSTDAASAGLLFDRLVQGKVDDLTIVLGILKAAARVLPPERLAELAPAVRAAAEAEHPLPDKTPPPYDELRVRLLLGGMRALAYAQAEAGLEPLCDIVLDPELQPSAFDFERGHWAPYEALGALRLYPAEAVHAAFGAAVRRAEENGRLARLQPPHLLRLLLHCREERQDGRRLNQVSLWLCYVLERLPYECDVLAEKMRTLGSLSRYEEAAAAAEAEAARKRARGITGADEFWTPERLDGRALLYRALAKGTPEAFAEIGPVVAKGAFLSYLAAWYLLFNVPDLAMAESMAEQARRRTGSLYHPHRDILAAVRNRQGRPAEALELLDPQERLPVKRQAGTGFHLLWEAKAHLLLGDRRRAAYALEAAMRADRRTISYAKSDEGLRTLEGTFRIVEEDFFDELFAWNS